MDLQTFKSNISLKYIMSYNKIPFIEVSGDNYEVGYQIGKKFKKQIAKTVKIPEIVATEHKLFKIGYFEKLSSKYFPYANKYFPDIINEIKGIADGANQDFEKIWLLNVEEVIFDRYFDKCTTIVARTTNNRIIVGHNEDFHKDFLDNMAMIKVSLNNGVDFLSLIFTGMLAGSSISINSSGITQIINSVSHNDTRIGIPKNFIARKALEAKGINEILSYLKIKERASGYSYNLIKDNEVYCIETSAVQNKVMKIKTPNFVHTNCYVSDLSKDLEKAIYSIRRKELIENLFKKYKNVDEKVIKNILNIKSKIYNGKEVVICHNNIKNEEDMTLATAFTEIGSNIISVIKDPSRNNKCDEYSLD